MNLYLHWILGCVTAYLFGSIPFGFLVAKSQGIDIRKVGSGNIGATNVFRCVSKPLGILTFGLDLAKGVAGSCLLPWLAAHALGGVVDLPLRVTCGFLTVAGHNWTIFLGFKGGKGIATSAGLLLGLAPVACGWAVLAWAIIFPITRYVSVASIVAAITLGIVAWLPFFNQSEAFSKTSGGDGAPPSSMKISVPADQMEGGAPSPPSSIQGVARTVPAWFPVMLDMLALLAIWRHRSNIQRLRQGTESQFTFRK